MHVLVVPSELYCPPKIPLYGIFQRQQAEIAAARGIQVGVASFGYIPLRHALGGFPYPLRQSSQGVTALRRFRWPLLPARLAYLYFRGSWVHGGAEVISEYIRTFGRPDLIHAHNCFMAGRIALEAKQAWGIPFLLTEHSSAFRPEAFSAVERREARAVLTGADLVSAVGTRLAEGLARAGAGPLEQVEVLGNALDPWIERRAQEQPPALLQPRGGLRLLAIGNLVAVKGHALLLQAFARAFKGRVEITLRIGGGGPLRAELDGLAASLGLARQVTFLGELARDQVVGELRTADALVVSSQQETFGVVAIEALAFGRPVLSTRCGGPEEFLDDSNGILVDQTAEALAEGMGRLRGHIHNPEALQRACIQRFGGEAFGSRLESLYHRVLAG